MNVTCVSTGPIQAGKCNVIFTGVCPVDAVINEVQSQAIGPSDLILHNDTPIGAIHPNPPNVRVISPVRPVQISVRGML